MGFCNSLCGREPVEPPIEHPVPIKLEPRKDEDRKNEWMPKIRPDYKFRNLPVNAEVKVVVCGASNAGKTQAILRYMQNNWVELSTPTEPGGKTF